MESRIDNFVIMNVVIIEPFYTASHKLWADGIVKYSRHNIQLMTLPGRHWKWRMHGAAVHFATQINALSILPDLIFMSDMMDLAVFKSLLNPRLRNTSVGIYMHENQITYPWSSQDPDVEKERDNHYGWINFTSCLAADFVVFNSLYHKGSFLNALPLFLKMFPDKMDFSSVEAINLKSQVIGVGLDLPGQVVFQQFDKPTFLWNHRWEFDKNPESFFRLLFKLKKDGYDFDLVVMGESFKNAPSIFKKAQKGLSAEIKHWGYLKGISEYRNMLLGNYIYPVTSNQDFFGIACLESIYYGSYPILPNRLAFPEHFSEGYRRQHFYDNDAELFQLVKTVLEESKWTIPCDLKQDIEKYKWQNIILQYDDLFLLMIETKDSK